MPQYNFLPEKIPLLHLIFFVEITSLKTHSSFLQQLAEKKLPSIQKTWRFCTLQEVHAYIKNGIPEHCGIAVMGSETFIIHTLHWLTNSKAPLIILPSESSSNFIHARKTPHNIDKALAKIKYQLFHKEDIFHFNNNQKAIYKIQWGKLPFSTSTHLLSKPETLSLASIEHDQGKHTKMLSAITATHLPLKGTPLYPNQKADDGLFEIFLFTKKPEVQGLSPEDYLVETIQTSYAQISFEAPQIACIDHCMQTQEQNFELYAKERVLWVLDQSTKLNTPRETHFFE